MTNGRREDGVGHRLTDPGSGQGNDLGRTCDYPWEDRNIMWNRIFLAAVVVAVGLGLGACQKEGPTERAGKKVDEAVNTVKDRLNDLKK